MGRFAQNYPKIILKIMMDLISEYNKKLEPMKIITGEAMRVHRNYKPGLVESAYEAALKYLLEKKGMKVERQVFLPLFWNDVQLDQNYRLDLVVDGIICELKAVNFVDSSHIKQLWSYMHITHTEYGMLINFGGKSLYSEWFRRDPVTGIIEKVKLL